jgi:hypothetical protein
MTPTRIARNISTVAVASIAAWSSWSHMVHVALRFGERPEVAYVLPISVDGMLVVASAAMVEDKRAGQHVRWSARAAFAIGVAASVAANIAAVDFTVGARIVAAWPAIALLLVVEMLSLGRTSPTGTSTDAEASLRPGDEPEPGQVDEHRDSSDKLEPHRNGRPTKTEDDVIRLRTERPDMSSAEIATQLGVSERHVRRLLARTGAA